ncbi:MAG: hypothetical protein ABI678_32120, partial [Kofleriaceae bacterium]
VVAQLNLVKNFAGNGIVKSLQVPYHCVACDRDKTLLVNVVDLRPQGTTAPTCPCDGCGEVMTFIDETGTYFAFVRDLKREPGVVPPTPAELARGSAAGVTTPQPNGTSRRRLSRASAPYLSGFPASPACYSTGRVGRAGRVI